MRYFVAFSLSGVLAMQLGNTLKAGWKTHLFAIVFAVGAAVGGWYLAPALIVFNGEDPWGWPHGMVTPFLCILGTCAGFGFGLLFGYGIGRKLFGKNNGGRGSWT